MKSNLITIKEVTGARAADLLRRSGIDIVFAGARHPDSFQAAHGTIHSVAALHFKGEITVFELAGGTKEERKARTEQTRKMLCEKFGATLDS